MVRTYAARVDVYRSGGKLTELKFTDPPTITASKTAEIKTGLSGEFRYSEEVNLLTDELRPVQIIDGVEHQCGVFHAASYTDSYADGKHTMRIEAYDKCFLIQQATAETTLYFEAGTLYLTAVEQLLVAAGIAMTIKAPSTAALQTDREFEIGTSYLAIINQLLSEINYGQVWFNDNGWAVLQPETEESAETVKHTYEGMDVRSVLSADAAAEVDIWDKPNVFVVICQNPDLAAPLIATSVNESPMSALSTYKRGRRIARVYNVDNIASQQELQNYADRLRNESMLSSETLTIYTANMPGHGIGDTVAVQHPQISGLYKEIGWRLTLGIGQLMQHDLQRKVLI